MIKLLRQHLLKNQKLVLLLNNKPYIFHEEKPLEIDADTYIVFKDKLLKSKYIQEYQIIFHVISKDINKAIAIERELIDYLNDTREEKLIKNDDTYIRNIKVLRGGGRIFDVDIDNWRIVVYFLLKK